MLSTELFSPQSPLQLNLFISFNLKALFQCCLRLLFAPGHSTDACTDPALSMLYKGHVFETESTDCAILPTCKCFPEVVKVTSPQSWDQLLLPLFGEWAFFPFCWLFSNEAIIFFQFNVLKSWAGCDIRCLYKYVRGSSVFFRLKEDFRFISFVWMFRLHVCLST